MKKIIPVIILVIGISIVTFHYKEDITGFISPSSTPTVTPTSTATATSSATPSPTATPTFTLTPTETYTPTPIPTPLGGSAVLLIDSGSGNHGDWFSSSYGTNILLKDVSSGRESKIGSGDSKLEDVGFEYRYLLISENDHLFITNLFGENVSLISDTYLGHETEDQGWLETTAFFLKSGDIVFLSREGDNYIINISSADDVSNPRPIYSSSNTIELFESSAYGILWRESGGRYFKGNKLLSLDTEEITSFEGYIDVLEVSPSGTQLAFMQNEFVSYVGYGVTYRKLYLLELDTMSTREIPLPSIDDRYLKKIIWGPEGDFLLLVWTHCDPTCDNYSVQKIDLEGNEIGDFPDILTERSSLSWSPDGKYLMIEGRFILDMNNYELMKLKHGGYYPRFYWIPSNSDYSSSGGDIPRYPAGSICEMSDPLCYRYYYIEKSLLNSSTYYYVASEEIADDGGTEAIRIESWPSGKVLRQYIFMFDPVKSTYTAALPINGEVVNFHGQAVLNTNVGDGWWQILLDDNVPDEISRKVYIDPSFQEISWKLVNGYSLFSELQKQYILDISY